MSFWYLLFIPLFSTVRENPCSSQQNEGNTVCLNLLNTPDIVLMVQGIISFKVENKIARGMAILPETE